MSTRIMSDCWPLAISPTQKSVLISLADQANDQGVCWPSIDTMAERTCLSPRSVRRAISELEKLGLLIRDGRSGRSNYYTITPGNFRGAPRTECHPTPDSVSAPDRVSPGHSVTPPRTECHPTPDTVSINPGQSVTQNRKEPSGNHQRTVREGHASAPSPLGENSPAKNSSRGTRLPSGWQLDPEYFAAAHEINPRLSNLQIIEIGNGFRDYWIAQPGSRGVKLDWLATWRNWVRRERGLPMPPPNNPGNAGNPTNRRTRDVSAYEVATDESW